MNNPKLTTQDVQQHLKENGLRLNAAVNAGRVICRLVNPDGNVVAASSKKTLTDAIEDIVQKTKPLEV